MHNRFDQLTQKSRGFRVYVEALGGEYAGSMADDPMISSVAELYIKRSGTQIPVQANQSSTRVGSSTSDWRIYNGRQRCCDIVGLIPVSTIRREITRQASVSFHQGGPRVGQAKPVDLYARLPTRELWTSQRCKMRLLKRWTKGDHCNASTKFY